MIAEPIDVTAYAGLGELLWDALIQHGSSVAAIEASRHREVERLSFTDLRKRARAVARQLAAWGVGPGDRVAILMSNQSRWLVAATAVFVRGAVLVPLDYKSTPVEQAALLAHARPAALITEYAVWRALPDVAVPHVLVAHAPDGADLRGAKRDDGLEDGPVEVQRRSREQLASVVYSSGTGGRPKGCMLTHGAYLSQLDALLACFPMAPGDRYFSILPTNHAIDFMCGFVGPVVCGATVVHQRALRPELILATMNRYRPTHMAVVPLVLAAFDRAVQARLDEQRGWKRDAVDALVGVHAALTERRPRHELSRRMLRPVHDAFGGRLRLVFCGGAHTDRAVAERFYKLGIPVVIGYGLTEACTVVTVHGLTPFRADGVGAPVEGVEVRIDGAGPDGVGEVCVRGPTLMRGYLDDAELTAEVLRDGWLHTGDLGHLDASGHLHLCGRSRDMIVTAGGKNVYPEDVEHAFADLPVEELVVFARNRLWPERKLVGEELLLVVRPAPPGEEGLGVDELLPAIGAANRGLADFRRVAGVVAWSEAFPRTASMKVKRNELAGAVAAGLGLEDVVRLG